MLHNLATFALSHLVGLVGGGTLVAAAGVLASKYLPGLMKKEEDAIAAGLSKVFAGVKDPAAKKFLVGFDKLVAEAVPDAGDAKYAMLTDLLLAHLPPQAAAARPVVLSALTALGAGAKLGLADAAIDPSH